jgi:hypothetical protein
VNILAAQLTGCLKDQGLLDKDVTNYRRHKKCRVDILAAQLTGCFQDQGLLDEDVINYRRQKKIACRF